MPSSNDTDKAEYAGGGGEIRGEVEIRFRFWRGSSEEILTQTFKGDMREVKDYAYAYVKGIKEADDWGGPG